MGVMAECRSQIAEGGASEVSTLRGPPKRGFVLGTAVVYRGASGEEPSMSEKKRGKSKGRDAAMPRTSVSFPPEVYKTLENLAIKKKVSIGWVVRDAVEKYVADQWPLFSNLKGN